MPRSTYYRMLAHPPRPKAPDPIEPDVLGAFEGPRGGYGARRPKVALERSGIVASRRRICRIMRENGLSSSYSGRAPKGGDRPVRPPSAENVLARSFDGHAPRAHVASDLTCVRIGGSWRCACLLVDLCNREIVGCSCGRRKDARLVKAAFSNVAFPLTDIEASTATRAPGSATARSTRCSRRSASRGRCRAPATPTTTPWWSRRTGCSSRSWCAAGPSHRGGVAQDGALRLGELVQQLQTALGAGLHDARRVQGGGPDPLVGLSKKVLPHQPHQVRVAVAAAHAVVGAEQRGQL